MRAARQQVKSTDGEKGETREEEDSLTSVEEKVKV